MIIHANDPEYLKREDPYQIRKDNLIDGKTWQKVRDYKREMSKKHLESFYKPIRITDTAEYPMASTVQA